MPKAAPLEDALAKKGGLTLSQLVDYDDRLTDALVDRVYYWTTIRKLRPGFHASRGVREEDVCRILQDHVVLEKDPGTAVQKLLELPALKRYLQSLKTKDEKEHFQRHLNKYVRIYMPDCPYEVCTTNRYTVTSHEASTIARKEIKKGEVIKYMTGIQVAMTKKEEQELDLKNRDFSIVMSSRKKVPSLFLGPARFANHDCNANARLSTTGAHGMQVVSVRSIQVGEEITVTYGDDYFGEDNCECLCATCETLRRNGWSRKRKRQQEEAEEASSDSPLPEGAATPDSYSLRRKRKFMFDAETHSPIPTSSESSSPAPNKGKRLSQEKVISTPGEPFDSPNKESTTKAAPEVLGPHPCWRPPRLNKFPRVKPAIIPCTTTASPKSDSATNADPETLGPHPCWRSPKIRKPPVTYSKLHRQRDLLSASSADDRSISPASSLLGNSQASTISTDATSVSDTADAIKPEPTSDAESTLTSLSSNCAFDDTQQRIVRKRKRGQAPTRQSLRNKSSFPAFPSIESSASLSDSDSDSSDDETGSNDGEEKTLRRKPGDYTLTALLLPTIYSRWVECRNCDDVFVQHDAYLTRANCPRCERHSKLYGYAWPKTDKEGRNDSEERVLDHREVHRFIDNEDEKREKKGRNKGVIAELKRERSRGGSRSGSRGRSVGT
ncbi:Histone-lysine N-methyltransferase set9 [Elsinoe australis]|uniref:Histone-lysine N-methyltransferase SET9 n=1 Tax=Elsinoe australis TaxID=40998 RepID=A0A2P7ZTY9_9PEZI|nr:Histone-lysine N-methyltransferase set9 [Elsinoe australis]